MEPVWLAHYDAGVPATLSYPDRPLQHFLEDAARDHPHQIATVFFGARMTYREVDDEANRLAHALQKLGISKGDRVALVLPNCPQYLIAFFAVVRLGAIVTNINPIYTPREVELVAKDSGMKAIIVLDLMAPTVLGVQANTAIENVIVTSVPEYSAKPETAPLAPIT